MEFDWFVPKRDCSPKRVERGLYSPLQQYIPEKRFVFPTTGTILVDCWNRDTIRLFTARRDPTEQEEKVFVVSYDIFHGHAPDAV